MLVVDGSNITMTQKGMVWRYASNKTYTNEQPLQDADVQILKRYVQQLQFL